MVNSVKIHCQASPILRDFTVMRRLGIPPSELSLLAAGQRHLITGILKKVLSGIPAYPNAHTKVQGLSFVCSTSEARCPHPL